jgi:dTDP-4-amino-4,6-dideoxygalactose transaminase
VIRLQLERIEKSHREVFDSLRQQGVGVNLHYIPVHSQPYYAALGFRAGDFPEAERYYAEAISLPMYAALSNAQQEEVVLALERALA